MERHSTWLKYNFYKESRPKEARFFTLKDILSTQGFNNRSDFSLFMAHSETKQ